MILILFCTASVVHLLVLYFVPDNVTLKIGSKIAPILVLIFSLF
ncbi:hypothetical protein LEP1GSC170_1336 [Leptospira interrogans serovar Bataviae str. HAI135]|nr:hypothetical protein LEP1GSC170_1336 [Leptospira interrogans serovar Bataviae str. HAI135]